MWYYLDAADKKVSSLTSIIGVEAYCVLQNACKPDKPKDKPFQQLTALLTSHYNSPVVEAAQSFMFYRYVQGEKQCGRLQH